MSSDVGLNDSILVFILAAIAEVQPNLTRPCSAIF